MVFVGNDHGGVTFKNEIIKHLTTKGIEIFDCGTYSGEAADYPDIAFGVCSKVIAEKAQGILICGTGIGVSICANKVKGIRAALCHSEFDAQMARKHNDANVLCLGERTTDIDTALAVTDIFLNENHDGGRHERRVEKITEYDNAR